MELREFGINKKMATILNKKHIYTVDDLARCFPRKYKDFRNVVGIDEENIGKECAIKGHLMSINKDESKRYVKAKLMDEENGIEFCVVWFGSTYCYNFYKEYVDENVVTCGKLKYDKTYGYSVATPDIFELEVNYKAKIMSVYRKFGGISESNFKKNLYDAIKAEKEILEDEVLKMGNVIGYKDALYSLHYPKDEEMIEKGSKRMVFNDLLYFSMSLGGEVKENKTKAIVKNDLQTLAFIDMLPYKLTDDQQKAIKVFEDNAKAGKRNNLLIQGDVGCGKTIVAISFMMLMAENGYQSVLMCPTKVLATQHFEEVSRYAKENGKTAVLFTNGLKASERKKILLDIVRGKVDFIIGTSSVLSDEVVFNNLGLIVTDEEHKFGVKQKEKLEKKEESGVHSVTMSATPIPRSIASIFYGGKEICIIKSMPKGRLPIQTCTQKFHKNTFEFIRKQIEQKHQCYVVCPAIEESEEIVSVEAIQKEYEKYFNPLGIKVGVVTGKLDKEELEETLGKFSRNEIQILISTTVIEVGINVPNATVMVVEQAERFGLASLHQLRGRVGRSSLQSYCILISEDSYNSRLQTMCRTTDGFEIAEEDLKFRGSGNLIGTSQSGSNKYIDLIAQDTSYFDEVRKIAKECIKKGYGKELMKVYEEHEQHEEQ